MADPMTIGTLVAAALSLGAEALVKGAVGEAVKDGYKALKDVVAHWAAGDVAELEKAPGSRPRQAVLAEAIDARTESEQSALRDMAEALVATLKAEAPAIGLDIGRITALRVQLGAISVASGIGARIQEAQIDTLVTGDITVGQAGGNAPR